MTNFKIMMMSKMKMTLMITRTLAYVGADDEKVDKDANDEDKDDKKKGYDDDTDGFDGFDAVAWVQTTKKLIMMTMMRTRMTKRRVMMI